MATGEDAPNKFGVLPVTKDEHAMAVEKVRHVGDLVACVAAVDEATAREAASLIKVEYEVLDSIHDMKKGLEDVDETNTLAWKISRWVNKCSEEFSKNLATVRWSRIQMLCIMEMEIHGC